MSARSRLGFAGLVVALCLLSTTGEATGAAGTRTENPPVASSPGAGRWVNLAVLWGGACGTRMNGTLWCWGVNTWGALGDGTTINRVLPVQVKRGSTWAVPSGGASGFMCSTRVEGSRSCTAVDTSGNAVSYRG